MVHPRIWPALTLAAVTPIAANLGVIGVMIVVVAVMIASDPSATEVLLADLTAMKAPPWLLAVGLVFGTLPFGVLPVLAASRSPVPFRERLGLVPARVRLLSLAVATVVGFALAQSWSSALSFVLPDDAFAYLAPLLEAIRSAPPAGVLLLTAAISVTPGICEELLFRGYVQRRLLTRWSPAVAIGVTSVLFSLAHLHPAHALNTLALSVWLGLVAWRTGSVWPSMVIHGLNNAFAMALTLWAPETWTELGMLLVAFPTAVVGGLVLVLLERSTSVAEADLQGQSGRGWGSVP